MANTSELKKQIKELEDQMVEELRVYSERMKNIRKQLEALREHCTHEEKHTYVSGDSECNICGKVL